VKILIIIDADAMSERYHKPSIYDTTDLDEMLSYEPTVDISKWISVNERMPKEHETEQDIYDAETLAFVDTKRENCSDLVNVVVTNNETCERFVCDDITTNGEWTNFSKDYFTVTYWMELPKLPNEVNNG